MLLTPAYCIEFVSHESHVILRNCSLFLIIIAQTSLVPEGFSLCEVAKTVLRTQ